MWLDTPRPISKHSLATPIEEICIGAFEIKNLRYHSEPEKEAYKRSVDQYIEQYQMLTTLFKEIKIKYATDDGVKNLAEELDKKRGEAFVTVCMANLANAFLG